MKIDWAHVAPDKPTMLPAMRARACICLYPWQAACMHVRASCIYIVENRQVWNRMIVTSNGRHGAHLGKSGKSNKNKHTAALATMNFCCSLYLRAIRVWRFGSIVLEIVNVVMATRQTKALLTYTINDRMKLWLSSEFKSLVVSGDCENNEIVCLKILTISTEHDFSLIRIH